MSALARRRLVALLAAASLAGSAAAKEAPAPACSILDVPPLIAWTKAPAGSSLAHCAILLAGRPHGEPAPRLITLCKSEAGLRADPIAPVAAESHDVASELGPDGSLRILVGRPGGIDEIRLPAGGAPATSVALVEDAQLEPYSLSDRPDLDGDGKPDMVQATYEGLALWKRGEDGGMTRLPGARLAPFARMDGEWVSVQGQYFVAPLPPASVRWTWPESIAGKRLRTYRVSLAGEREPCAAWIDSESQVDVQQGVFLSGEPPRLVALVAPRDKLAVFGNLTLLVVPLACDETARGSRATMRVATHFDSNFGWKNLGVRDVTGDGKQDIVIVGRQGLLNEKLEVAVHAGTEGGGFAATPASAVRSDLDPLGALWEDDQDGDGKVDLVVLDRTRVLLARGIAVRGSGDMPFDLRKSVLVPLPGSVTPKALLGLLDFDGDGRLEALVRGEERKDEGKKKGARAPSGGGERDTRIVVVPFPEPSR